MKECPNCKKEYSDDVEFCLADGTVLETSVKISEAETVALPAEAIPPTVEVKQDDIKTEVLETKQTIISEATKPAATVAQSRASAGGGLSTFSRASIVLLAIFCALFGLLFWKINFAESGGLTKLTKEDMQTIFKDANPMALKKLAEDPEFKKKQVEDIKEFLAIAAEARATGLADKPEIKEDFEKAEKEIVAAIYDKEKNKDKQDLPPFSSITKEQIDAYFQQGDNQAKFDKTIKEQIEKLKKAGRLPENFEPQPDQLEQAKESFAKINISYDEAKANWAGLSKEVKDQIELQVKLQQSAILGQTYSKEVLAEKIKVTDEEVNKYLAEHPEEAKALNEKKAKAEELLQRALKGEDFAKLATENSEDPGSKKDGGLYKDVGKGGMVPEFEQAALSLQPGQIADHLIESKYGWHIIKLEKKETKKAPDGKESETYDARHILISSMTGADPNNPMAQPKPLKEAIKEKLGEQKEKKILEEIVARHPITIEDFEVKVPEMPAGQEGIPGGPGGQQLDPKQIEEIQRRMKEMQEKSKNAPKNQGKPASNSSSASNK